MRRRHLLMIITVLLACSKAPVEWSGIVYSGARLEPSDYPSPLESSPSRSACPGSLRIANSGNEEYSTWWEARQDSSVVLMTARRSDSRQWSKPVVADSTDHGVRGCGRPAPAIAADSASGYVHVAYFAEPASGAGIFFAHSMDKAATFHSPVPIVFGKNPSRASVASNGDRVVVAYEDPNSTQPIVGIALSKTMGHIFESRSIASSENGRARQPVVRIEGDSIRLWWSEYSPNPAVSATRPRYRAGLWRER
jgi:hypothetical protein